MGTCRIDGRWTCKRNCSFRPHILALSGPWFPGDPGTHAPVFLHFRRFLPGPGSACHPVCLISFICKGSFARWPKNQKLSPGPGVSPVLRPGSCCQLSFICQSIHVIARWEGKTLTEFFQNSPIIQRSYFPDKAWLGVHEVNYPYLL